MAEAIVSIILEQLASITRQQIEGEVKLVVGVDDDVRKLTSNFLAIGAVLEDAESRQFKDDTVRGWLDKLKDVSYEIDDVLDEWNTSIRKLQIEKVENAMIGKVCSIFPRYRFCLRPVVLRHDIALMLKDLSKTIDVIATEKNMFGFSLKESTIKIKRPMTTSIVDILEVQGNIFSLRTLSDEESWLLFNQIAFFERTKEERKKLEYIGRKIIGKCKGFSLAIKILGSLLLFKTNIEEWQSVLDSEMWELDGVEKRFFPPLLMSYYDLPSILKKCFLYCAIFPKNYEIEKDKLIKLWMSQNFLKEEQTKNMESIGEEYFEILAMRSFFQKFKKNEFDGNIESCKMHDIVYNFAQLLTKNECFNIEIDDFEKSRIGIQCIKVQHLVIQVGRRGLFLLPICNEKQLRSLVVKGGNIRSTTLSKLFGNFTCLRRLDLIDCSIRKIPRDIQKLIHLRYIDFSENKDLKELPEILCELYNLQTLNVSFCEMVRNLPQDMGKLINLRHLININTYSLSYIPKGIERLTCLRILNELKLSHSTHGGKAFSIECFENLNNLRSIDIFGLETIMDVFEVKRANLKNKGNLFSLGLFFNMFRERRERMNENDEIILEALEPPPNLVKLKVWWYQGTIWPNWMMSLTQLRELCLDAWYECEYLHPLGRSLSLESLYIGKTSVKMVGNEFSGIESNTATSSFIAFPKLKNLTFSHMDEWEEWDVIKGDKNITIMPSLVSLTIIYCQKLKNLPDHIFQIPTLKHLEIIDCSILEKRFERGKGVDWYKISHIPNIIIK